MTINNIVINKTIVHNKCHKIKVHKLCGITRPLSRISYIVACAYVAFMLNKYSISIQMIRMTLYRSKIK